MTNNPFEVNNSNKERAFEDVNKQAGSKVKIVVIAVVAFLVTLIILGALSAFFQSPQEPEETQVSLEEFGVGELEVGENIILKSSDVGECRQSDTYLSLPCSAFNSNQHFKPGLYTIKYTPIANIDNNDYLSLSLHLNFNDYLEFNREGPETIDYFSAFPDLDNAFTIENVAFQEDAYIVFYELMADMEFTIELIPQTEYIPFENNSGVTGFYPVGLTINTGKYRLDADYSLYPSGEIAVLSYEGLSDSEVDELYIYNRDKFELKDNEIFVSFNPTNSLG